jgi:hypothetical protein
MFLIKNIYDFLYSFFDFISFRTKPKYDDIDNNEEYEFIFLNENVR